jgi:hypothetical protein
MVAGVLSLGVAARAERVVISTGNEGGSYYYIGQRLKTELILAKEQPPVVMTSQGSIDNLARLDDPDSSVNVVLAQADAVRVYLETHPDFAGELLVLGDMGKECALLVTGAKSDLHSAADLKKDTAGELSIDAPGSGASVTFETMSSLDSAFRATRPVFVPIMEALLQVKVHSEFTKLKTAMLVQRPRRVSPPLRLILKDPDSYRFIPIVATDLPNASLPDGSPIYSFESVAVGPESSRYHQEIETLCTRALLLGSADKLDRELRGRLSKVLLTSGERIAGDDE